MRTPGCVKNTVRAFAIEHHVVIVHRRQRRFDFGFGRLLVRAEVVHEADARVRDVERAFGDARKLERGRQQIEQLLD